MNTLYEWIRSTGKIPTQAFLIVEFFFYFGQRIYELHLKKKEIKFNKLYENKIIEIKAFYKSYQALYTALKEYAYQTEFGEHSDEIFKRIKENINQKIIDFSYNSMIVKIFIDRNDIVVIDEIAKSLEEIRFGVAMWHNSRSHNLQEKYDDKLTQIVNEIIPNKLPGLIKEIESSLRKSFDIN